MLRLCVTTRQNSSALPRTISDASGSPHIQGSPDGPVSSTRGLIEGGDRFLILKLQENVVTPIWATWRSRSVFFLFSRRVSQTSWVCAHVSMRRAVAKDRALIPGPYQMIRSLGFICLSFSNKSARVFRQRDISSSGCAVPNNGLVLGGQSPSDNRICITCWAQ